MVRTNHLVLVVRFDLIGLYELMQSTLGILKCPVAMEIGREVSLLCLFKNKDKLPLTYGNLL